MKKKKCTVCVSYFPHLTSPHHHHFHHCSFVSKHAAKVALPAIKKTIFYLLFNFFIIFYQSQFRSKLISMKSNIFFIRPHFLFYPIHPISFLFCHNEYYVYVECAFCMSGAAFIFPNTRICQHTHTHIHRCIQHLTSVRLK